MPRDTNLTRRGAVYYARIFVPKDLQSAMGGKTEIRPSLRTTDYAEAKRRKAALVDQWTSTFDEMRRNNNLTDRIVADGIRQLYEAGIKAADDERLARPTPDEIDRATDEALAAARESGAAELGGYAMINAMVDVEILVGKAEWAARRRASRLARLQAVATQYCAIHLPIPPAQPLQEELVLEGRTGDASIAGVGVTKGECHKAGELPRRQPVDKLVAVLWKGERFEHHSPGFQDNSALGILLLEHFDHIVWLLNFASPLQRKKNA